MTPPTPVRQVHLQTQQEVKLRMTGMALRVVRSDGVLALYNGLSASLCRQMTYSLTRFAIYESVRDRMSKGSQGALPFHEKVLLGSISGLTGGFVGTPADLVNVRMQNDMKLPLNQRRNCPAMTRPSSWSSALASCLTTSSRTSLPASLQVFSTVLWRQQSLDHWPFSRASFLLASVWSPTPCSPSCFWNSSANTLASKCCHDGAMGAGWAMPSHQRQLLPKSPGGSAPEPASAVVPAAPALPTSRAG
ncbi:PREDICTED: mitochondrial dicarboxylate carrier isoform X2 [Galeopterus variegatus]|uniref:Mitochondrial dicarboxylate carrier isoform X2 n=1 Tax=Galeopterus variegatus TaxID=482537 RepID=A0ABM0R1N3_GALVR|nr:PREDICTED: mitochondrial dicarboxylate carrier isoform X2 [Galeopterus variegatus]